MPSLLTIGHSVLPIEAFTDALLVHGVEVLVDVRRSPRSRHPQFNGRALAAALREAGIEYRHFEALGNRRPELPESPNTAIGAPGLRVFADYMATPPFAAALEALIALSTVHRVVAIMCAEREPSSCHRSLIADALVGRGFEVGHLVREALLPHRLHPHARVEDGRIVYRALL